MLYGVVLTVYVFASDETGGIWFINTAWAVGHLKEFYGKPNAT